MQLVFFIVVVETKCNNNYYILNYYKFTNVKLRLKSFKFLFP